MFRTGILTACLTLASIVSAQGADVAKGEQMCIDSNRIEDTRVVGKNTILVRMSPGPRFARIDLANNCSTLDPSTGFAFDTSINKLCEQTTLSVLNRGQACIIDKIVTIGADEAHALERVGKK